MTGMFVTFTSTAQHHNPCILNTARWKRNVSESHTIGEKQIARTCHTKLYETALQRKLVADKLMQAHQDIEVRERLADTC